MTDYVEIADAIHDTLKADSWLSDTNNLKAIEVFERGNSEQGDEEVRPVIKSDDLPLVTVEVNISPKEDLLDSPEEVRVRVACAVIARTSNRDAQIGRRLHYVYIDKIEQVLGRQRDSQNDFSIDGFVREIGTTESIFKQDNIFYFESITTFTMEITRTFN